MLFIPGDKAESMWLNLTMFHLNYLWKNALIQFAKKIRVPFDINGTNVSEAEATDGSKMFCVYSFGKFIPLIGLVTNHTYAGHTISHLIARNTSFSVIFFKKKFQNILDIKIIVKGF